MKQIKLFIASAVLLLFTCQLFAAANYPSPTEIVRSYFSAVDKGDIAELNHLLSDDLIASAPFSPQPLPKQAWLGVAQSFKAAFPDMKHDISGYLESGYNVAVRGVFKGQNDGPMMGNPATGNRVEVPFNTIVELDKSWQIKAIYIQFDQKSFETQLTAGLTDKAAGAEATIRLLLAAADAGDAEKFMSFWAPEGENYFAGKLTSNEDMKKRIPAFKTAFPDIKRNLEDVVVSGNTVTVRGVLTGTNKGVFMGNAPTGNAVKVSWLGFYKLNPSGKIISGWVEFDTVSLIDQVSGKTYPTGK